jgi:uncharacterized protein
LIENPFFYLTAIPAVILYGIAKGGFAGPLAILGVPLMSLVISPIQAAAILLPILCIQDLIAVYFYRKKFHLENLKILIPGALFGITVGFFWFQYLSESHIRLLIGIIALGFVISYLLKGDDVDKTLPSKTKGTFWGSLSGFTSFGIHAGGLPFNIYMLPQKLDQRVYAGSAALFFCMVNYVKLYPYYLLDQLRIENLYTSLILVIFAPFGFAIGYFLTHKVDEKFFYGTAYFGLSLIGLKLSYDGIMGL